ncbi:flagellar protein FlaG [Candidatus Nitrotoga sp. M5]|uniref:flagellar protein FlaG n=1 Tax=Candidatus Nitrotoga sp. M5 TaxID=2890409 RepID=UPI001EF6528A|nr:flagellar protein FlaG [Candidatus Nitrotoga sp. M5]CAH1387775.1 Flagellin protein flaG [Candidatus Nitrotoga sp. M5]
MLHQISSNLAQASPPDKISNNGLANNGKPVIVSTPPANGTAQPAESPALPQVSAVKVAEQPVSSAQLESALSDANKVFEQSNRSLEFSVDTDTKRSIVKLIDTETGDLIRQFPSEQMLAIASAIGQFQQGVLLDQKT